MAQYTHRSVKKLLLAALDVVNFEDEILTEDSSAADDEWFGRLDRLDVAAKELFLQTQQRGGGNNNA